VRHPNSTPHARWPSRTIVGVHGVPPSDDLESEWGLAPRDQTDVVSKHPLQLLLGELLQRPIEFTGTAAIRVVQEPRVRAATRHRHLEGFEREVPIIDGADRPTHDEAREQIEHRRSPVRPFERSACARLTHSRNAVSVRSRIIDDHAGRP
jgi:hypothetical protein